MLVLCALSRAKSNNKPSPLSSMPARLSSMELSPASDPDMDNTAKSSRRKSGRVSRKPEVLSPSHAPAKRKRGADADEDEDEELDDLEDDQGEPSDAEEEEPDEEEIRDRKRKTKSKPRSKPAPKKSKTSTVARNEAGGSSKTTKSRPRASAGATPKLYGMSGGTHHVFVALIVPQPTCLAVKRLSTRLQQTGCADSINTNPML